MTIYTAIFGDYDELKQPFFITDGWRHVCFTDQDLQLPENNVWEIRKVPVMEWGSQKTARWFKINFHKCIEDRYSIWIDATFFINTNLDQWWEERFIEPFGTIYHPYDSCIYKDARACLELGKGDPNKIKQQVELYSHLGIKKNSGLISSGILMRENTLAVKRFCTTWWQQVEAWSSRDQISFGYAQWKHPGVHHSTKWNYTEQREFVHIPHKNKPWRKQKFDEIVKQYGIKG